MSSPQQYQAEQKAAVAAVIASAATTAALAGAALANFTVWMKFLRAVFPAVVRARYLSAWSARQFYDSERRRVTGKPVLPAPLVEYDFQRFTKAMVPAYQMVVGQLAEARAAERAGTPMVAKVESTVRVVIAREVTSAGREQMKSQAAADNRAISTPITAGALDFAAKDLDAARLDEPVGWVRVLTGDENCGWCVMLASRGVNRRGRPVGIYQSARSGDLPIDDIDYLEEYFSELGSGRSEKQAAKDISERARKAADVDGWHPGCDCLIVPYFGDKDPWWLDSAKEAMSMYVDASKIAEKLVAANPDRKYRIREVDDKGKVTYRSVKLSAGDAIARETVNTMRQMART